MYLKNARFYHIYANKNRYDYEKEKEMWLPKRAKNRVLRFPQLKGKFSTFAAASGQFSLLARLGAPRGKPIIGAVVCTHEYMDPMSFIQ